MFDCFNGYLLFDRELVSIIYLIHILTSFKLSTFSFISDCKCNLGDQDNWRKWYFYLPGLGLVLVQDSEVRTELNHAIVHNTVTPAHRKYDSIFASNNTFILSSSKVKIQTEPSSCCLVILIEIFPIFLFSDTSELIFCFNFTAEEMEKVEQFQQNPFSAI